MNLTIKEIMPYIPYNVRACIIMRDGNLSASMHLTLDMLIWSNLKDVPTIGRGKTQDWLEASYPIKLVLKPMKDLTKEELLNECFDDHIDFLTNEHQENPQRFRIERAPYEMVQFLISKHYDVFGLIPKELAVDINFLNFKLRMQQRLSA